ncbi:hypothetical protein, partial [Maribrevibacterium harenarium]
NSSLRVLLRLLVNSVSAKESWFMVGRRRSQIKSARLSHIADLIACLLDINESCWSDITLSDLENYLSYISYQAKPDGKPKNSNASIRRKISSLNSFYRYQTFYSGINVTPLIVKKYYKQRSLVTGKPRKHEQYSIIEGIRKSSLEGNIRIINEADYVLCTKLADN